ncbi:MAG: hypothetical protein R3A10_14730 [Caldilineaceae bacterium]
MKLFPWLWGGQFGVHDAVVGAVLVIGGAVGVVIGLPVTVHNMTELIARPAAQIEFNARRRRPWRMGMLVSSQSLNSPAKWMRSAHTQDGSSKTTDMARL